MSLFLGIDVGTTATKALLLDPARGVVAEAERPTQLYSEQPGWSEEDTAEWWANVCAVTRELAASRDVAGVGVSGMVPCTILLDEHGEPLRRSIQQNDARSGEEVRLLRGRLASADILRRTGSAITQQSTAPRFLWLQEHEPELWRRARTVVGSYDYITMRLTGERSVESNWALETGLLELSSMRWAADVLDASGASASLLPTVRRPHEIAGKVTKRAAAETGLAAGTPVVAGTADHIGSTFAAGILEDGDMLIKLGGAGDIMLVSNEARVDDRLNLDFHLLPDRYVMSGCMATSGSLIRWFQRELAGGESLSRLDEEAARTPPGADGVIALPYFLGEKTPINDPDTSGAFVGLRLTHGRGHLFRAVLEAVGFGFRHHLDVFRELGCIPRRVRVTDGGSQSKVWTQTVADIIGLPMEKVTLRSGSAFAAAFTAGIGTGAFSSWRDIERFVVVSDVVRPRPLDVYDHNYAVYRSLYPALKEVMQ